jgi:hypothetical protein
MCAAIPREAAMAKDGRKDEMQPRSATSLLKKDHKEVKDIFNKYESSDDADECVELMEQAILELKVHTQVEEEIFYPAAREALDDDAILDEAEEEHHVAKMLIDEIEHLDADDSHVEAKFKVLMENVRHHIREEEGEMFPKIEDEEFNKEVVDQMWERKQELLQEIGGMAPKVAGKDGKDAAPRGSDR